MKDPVRIVWITGASSGIGRALAESFVRHGETVIATARREEKLLELQNELQNSAGQCVVSPCDVQKQPDVLAMAGRVIRDFGRLDILINGAGVTYFKDFLTTTAEELDHALRTNLSGAFFATQAVLPMMIERRDGIVMNIVSYAAKATYTLSAAYSASKAGLEAMMDGLRAEVRDKGIKVINVFPGPVLTPIWHPKHREKYADRMMKPEEIAEFLYDVTRQPKSMMIEDVIIRPQTGDLKI